MPPRDTEGRPRRKERRRLLAESLPMARRRAYRASQEALDQGMHLWKTADNKARFALMLLGPLNAVLLVLLSNTDLFRDIPSRERIPIVAGIVTYAALATAMFLLAIGTLRPERAQPIVTAPPRIRRQGPLGIRHYEDILRWELDGYQHAWQCVTREQLVEEVAEQAHAVAEANRRKYRTLYYLFRGLQGMTALALVLLLAIGAALVFEGQTEKIHLKRGVQVTVPPLRHRPGDAPAAAHGSAGGRASDMQRGQAAHGS